MKKLLIVITFIALFTAYIFTFNMSSSSLSDLELIPFDEEGFVDSMELTDTNKLVTSNDQFELYLDETTSYFEVVDKETGAVWASNPTEPDPWELDDNQPITNSALSRQQSTLELSYYNETGSLTTVNNHGLSIYHPETILYEEGTRTFEIKYVEGGFQVLYEIVDLEIDYLHFPKYLDKDFLEGLDQYDLLTSLAYTGFNEELNAYEISSYESMTRLVKSRLYNVFYDQLEYTREQAIAENREYGYFEEEEQISFNIGVQVLLTDEGVKTSIMNESIKEMEDVRVGRISLYPLFGTAVSFKDGVETEGYMVVPDGSGAVIEFNNDKVLQNSYRKQLYGTDLAMMPFRMEESQEKIHIPLYGMVKDNTGYAAIITEGDAMAILNAEVSGRTDSYNKLYPTFNLRERERVTIGSGPNSYGIDLWTEDIVKTDFTVEYTFLEEDDASYLGMADVYKNYLMTHHDLTPKQTSDEVILTTEFVGAYDRKNFFLGVPYFAMDSMTTFEEAEIIIDALTLRNINNIDVLYTGMFNGGLDSSIHDRANIEKVLGGDKGFKAFDEYLEAQGFNVYPTTDFMTASDYEKMFDQYRYSANRVRGNISLDFTYHIPSRLPYSETPYMHRDDSFVLNPSYYQAIYNRFSDDFDHNALSFTNLGGKLAGHYDREAAIYLQDALRYQEAVLKQSEAHTLLSSPLGFALPYADKVTDLPTSATLYPIIDYSIPLLQLVLNGVVDYSASSINMASDRSTDYKFLKVLETGSHLKYTLSYEDSRKLIDTDFNYYMSTHYENWLDSMEENVSIVNSLGIHKGTLTGHERLQNNVYKVTYSHGLEFVINYNLNPRYVDSYTIDGMSYLILEGGE